MGARQSKRSVDIAAGKEGETVGEVAGAGGAAGEGRLERIEDADAAVTAPLKPQLNGDAPHTETIQVSDKEKKLQDNGTPENEKDNTTEKEINEKEDKDKEIILSPVNGSGDELDKETAENGDAKAAEAENNKKNKKVKKKWSLRSISFSKKDKQKPDKPDKQKKDETNGECDKVPEETAEATVPKVEVAEIKTPEETERKESPKVEERNEKTPETPVTEPITNGSSAPETPKEETTPPIPAVEATPVPVVDAAVVPVVDAAPVPIVEAAPAPVVDSAPVPSVDATPIPVVDVAPVLVEVPSPEPITEAPKNEAVVSDPDELPIKSLNIEDVAVLPKVDEDAASSEAVVTTAESDILAAPAPVASEVCVAASSVEDAVPPPLPVNPPPSSLTAFATTTMAPHLVTATAQDPPHTPLSPHTHTPHSPLTPHSTPTPIPEELETNEQDTIVAEIPVEAASTESVVARDVPPSDEAKDQTAPVGVVSITEIALIAEAIPSEEVASAVEIVTTDGLAPTVEVTPILDEASLATVPSVEDVDVADVAPFDESAHIIETCSLSNVVEPKEIKIVADVVPVTASTVSEAVSDTQIQSVLSNTDSKQIEFEETDEPIPINTAVASDQPLPAENISENSISGLPEILSEPVPVNTKMTIDENDTESLESFKVESTETEYEVKDAELSAVEVEAIRVVSEILESIPVTATTPVDKVMVEQALPTLDSPPLPSPNGRQSPTEAVDCQETLEEVSKVADIVSGKISELSVESSAPVSIPEMTNGDTDTGSGDAGTTE